MKKTWLFGAAAVAMSLALANGPGAQAQTAPGAPGQQPDTVKVTGCLQQSGSIASASGGVGTSGVTARQSTGTPATSTAGFVLLNARAGMGAGGAMTPNATTGTSSAAASPGSPTSAPNTGAASLTGTAAAPPVPGTTAVPGNPGDGLSYLDGQNSELRDHVGHQVEITGVVAASRPAAKGGLSGQAATANAAGPATATGQTGALTPGANTNGLLAGGATAVSGSPATGATASAASTDSAKAEAAGVHLEVQSVRMIAPNCSPR